MPGRYEYSVYALIPFGVPVHAEAAGIIPADFSQQFGFARDLRNREFYGFYGTGTENHGKSDISTGTVSMATGYQDFFGNCLDGSRERYLHGNGKNIFPVKSWGKFPREFSRGKP